MTDHHDDERKVAALTPREQAQLRDALSSKFGAHLRPGESLAIDVERGEERCRASIVLEDADASFRFELEVVALASDADDSSKWDPAAEMENVLDLLDVSLEDYFAEERTPRFHDDWRVYDYRGAKLRLRGQTTRPDLEALADQWLAAGGDPGRKDFD